MSVKKSILHTAFGSISILICLCVISHAQSVDPFTEIAAYKDASERPDLAVDVNKVAKFRAFTPKMQLKYDDRITLDFALLTSDSDWLFYPVRMRKLHIHIHDLDGKEIPLEVLSVFDAYAKFGVFRNEVLRDSVYLAIGCNGDSLSKLKKDHDEVDEDDSAAVFERNLFQSFPSNCIDVKKPGEIELTLEFSNRFVAISKDPKEQKRTAVGQIKSNTIRLKVEF